MGKISEIKAEKQMMNTHYEVFSAAVYNPTAKSPRIKPSTKVFIVL
mgnify:CR=1 FL=1